MPFTLAHPAAVLPLKRFCRSYANFSALVAGSMAPDIPYFFFQWHVGGYAHTLPGIFLLSIPIGLSLMLLFDYVGPKAAKLLPNKHAQFVESWFHPAESTSKSYATVLVYSLIGILTHVFWDSFTHSTGWFVHETPILETEVATIGTHHIHFYKLLQHGSTVVGLLALVLAYWINFKYYARTCTSAPNILPTTAWLAIILGTAIMSVAMLRINSAGDVHMLLVRFVIYYVDIFLVIVTTAAIIRNTSGRPNRN